VVSAAVTDDRPVVVVSKGDPILVDLGDRTGWHYPQNDDGVYAGYYPADSATAVHHLERLRDRGAGYFLVPATCGWWLRHYGELREHLEAHHQLVAEDASCVLYRLTPVDANVAASTPSVADLAAQIEHLRSTLAATGEWVSDLAPRVVATSERVAG